MPQSKPGLLAALTRKAGVVVFLGLLITGSVVIAGIIQICKQQVTWTGGWPIPVLASAVPAWALLLLGGIQVWDVARIEDHRSALTVEKPDVWARWKDPRLHVPVSLLVAVAGFFASWKFW